mmetsp:Transcript_3753/g.6908  ORF Transcript_3753/g.6908 Transcript_3753/m.6908 type:complete len:237 (-) Transcript_3753:155-865(-)
MDVPFVVIQVRSMLMNGIAVFVSCQLLLMILIVGHTMIEIIFFIGFTRGWIIIIGGHMIGRIMNDIISLFFGDIINTFEISVDSFEIRIQGSRSWCSRWVHGRWSQASKIFISIMMRAAIVHSRNWLTTFLFIVILLLLFFTVNEFQAHPLLFFAVNKFQRCVFLFFTLNIFQCCVMFFFAVNKFQFRFGGGRLIFLYFLFFSAVFLVINHSITVPIMLTGNLSLSLSKVDQVVMR